MASTTATQDHAFQKELEGDGVQQWASANGNVNGNGNGHEAAMRSYGGNPLAHMNTGESARYAAFGGEFQPGLYKPTTTRKFGNPAPLGLSAFALTSFVLSLINVQAKNVTDPNIVVGLAFGYGGLIQLLAGMWEMAVGNTFGATALSSYGGFWMSFAIIFTPGGFDVKAAYEGGGVNDFSNAFGFFLIGWFIFTTLMLICTLRSTVAFFLVFLTVDLAFLMLAIGHLNAVDGEPNTNCIKAGGYFGLMTAFMAWYNAFAGIADSSNSSLSPSRISHGLPRPARQRQPTSRSAIAFEIIRRTGITKIKCSICEIHIRLRLDCGWTTYNFRPKTLQNGNSVIDYKNQCYLSLILFPECDARLLKCLAAELGFVNAGFNS